MHKQNNERNKVMILNHQSEYIDTLKRKIQRSGYLPKVYSFSACLKDLIQLAPDALLLCGNSIPHKHNDFPDLDPEILPWCYEHDIPI